MPETLPNELVDCILDNLYYDTETLLNCALVDRAWVSPAQRGIFRQVVLHDNTSYLKATLRLDALFDAKPHLAAYVQLLELRWFTALYRHHRQSKQPSDLHIANANIVQRLSNVKKLLFFRVDWTTLFPVLKEALVKICMAPSVTQVSLVHFKIPTFAELVSLLTRFRNLKVLDASAVCHNWECSNSLLERATVETSCAPRSIQLNRLRLDFGFSINAFMTWFRHDSCPFEVRNLQSLEIPGWVDRSILQYLGAGLKDLKLCGYVNADADSDPSFAHLGCTPNIRSLSLIQLRQINSLGMRNPVPWIHALFEPLLTPNGHHFPLQHLTVELDIVDADLSGISQYDQWGMIDILLQRPEFVQLETVNFKLISLTRIDFLPNRVRELLVGKLAFLDKSGKLTMQIVANSLRS